jgi:hypothetical protein
VEEFDDMLIRPFDVHDPDWPLVATRLLVGPLGELAVSLVDLVAEAE